MDFILICIVGVAAFGLCFLCDYLFKKLFRNKQQHQSGKSVRFTKRYGSFGALMITLSFAAVFSWLNGAEWILGAGGALIGVVGVGLVVYYLTFGIYYDDDGFLLNSFGQKGVTYQYGDILGQKLYTASGNIIVELYMKDGKTMAVQSTMEGVYPFLDEAFSGWCRQTGHDPEACEFHDTANSRWFPDMEEQ